MLTHWERAYQFFGQRRDDAKKLYHNQGVASYLYLLDKMMHSTNIAPDPTDNSKYGKFTDAFYENRWSQLLAALNIEILSKSMTSCGNPYAFHLSANSSEMNEFNNLVFRTFKQHDPKFDEKSYYSVALTGIIQNWSYLIHEHAGKKVYEVSPGLAEKLRHTELRGLRSDDLKLPYPSVYVMIPKSKHNILKLYNEDTGWHELEGFYLTEDPIGEDPDHPVRTWRFMFVGAAHEGANRFDDALFHFSIELPENTTLSDILKKEQEIVDNGRLIADETAREIFNTEWLNLFHWAMNVIMYSTWPDIEVDHFMANDEARSLWNRIAKLPKGRKKDELKERFKKLLPQHRIRLGRSISLWDTDSTDDTESGRQYRRVRTLVSGFWMRQAYGEGRSLRRWRYQPPYWRNRDSVEESNSVHVLS